MSRFALALILELLSLLAAQGAPPSSIEADKARAAVAVAVAVAALNDAKPVVVPQPMPAKPVPAGCQCGEDCKCKPGECPSKCPVQAVKADAPSPVGNPPSPAHEWGFIPGAGWGWKLKSSPNVVPAPAQPDWRFVPQRWNQLYAAPGCSGSA
jgi:hypothetical protein